MRANLYDVLIDIIAWHVRGTRYGLYVVDIGLWAGGEAWVYLTWMYAVRGRQSL